MVRINLIRPVCLTDQHLLAEYNEILMLCGYVKKYHGTQLFHVNRPASYKLGKGHIKFFTNKLEYLYHRFHSVRSELMRRNYEVTKDFPLNKEDYPALWNNYEPDTEDYFIILQRLNEKIKLKTDEKGKVSFYTYYGLPILLDCYSKQILDIICL
jgi:deoxyribonuclease (pyrimidine dimer)